MTHKQEVAHLKRVIRALNQVLAGADVMLGDSHTYPDPRTREDLRSIWGKVDEQAHTQLVQKEHRLKELEKNE